MTHRPNDHIDPTLLERYLSRTCTVDEERAVQQWMAVDPLRSATLHHIRTDADSGSAAEVAHVWHNVQRRIADATAPSAEHVANAGKQSRGRSQRSWAAAGAGALAMGGFAILVAGLFAPRVWRTVNGRSTDAPPHVYATHRGEQATVMLPDGSSVMLGPETTVRFSAAADQRGARTVHVDGQAFFTVVPDRERPFLVRTANTTTRVLGTAFSVRKYITDATVRVLVASGKVSVGRTSASRMRETVLTANMLAQLTDSGDIAVTRDVVMDDELAWTKGRLVFRNTPVSTVVQELERRYDVVIRFADSSLANDRITALLDSETTQEALGDLAIALSAHYTQVGRVVTFAPTRRALRRVPARSLPSPESHYGR